MSFSTYEFEAGGAIIVYGPGRLSLEKVVLRPATLLEKLQNDARIGQSPSATGGKYRVYALAANGMTIERVLLFWMPLEKFLRIDDDRFFEIIEDMKEKHNLRLLNIESPSVSDWWIDVKILNERQWETILPASSSDQEPPPHTFYAGNLGVSIIPLMPHRAYQITVPRAMEVTIFIEP